MKIIPVSLCFFESIYFVINVTFNNFILNSFIQLSDFSDASVVARVPSAGELGGWSACPPPTPSLAPPHTPPLNQERLLPPAYRYRASINYLGEKCSLA